MTVTIRRSSPARLSAVSGEPHARQNRAASGVLLAAVTTGVHRQSVVRRRGAQASSRAGPTRLQARAPTRCLVDDAVALGEPEQRVELFVRRIGLQLEAQPDRPEPHRHVAVDAERPAKIEVSFGVNVAALDRQLERGRDGAQRHAGARDQRLEQHVARAERRPVSAARRVQAGRRERTPRPHRAGDAFPERPIGAQRHQRRIRILAVPLLQRLLHATQRSPIHETPPSRQPGS